ncbi:MAG TPA: hypothetical protein VL099_06910 [Candidatus Binatia bacterium]|nr:hypothetical protein [Candidatus Binatia bacterium]
MRFVARPAAALALLLLFSAPAWSGEKDASKTDPNAEKKAAPAGETAAASDKTPTPAQPTAGQPDPAAATTASESSPESAADGGAAAPPAGSGESKIVPVAPLIGERATTFTLESGEMLGRHVMAFSTGVNKFARAPGDTTVLNLDLNLAVGVTDRFSAFIGFTPYGHTHVGRPTQLSLNQAFAGCPLVGTSIYPDINCGAVLPGAAAYVEDYPFATHNGGGVGPLDLGFKFNMLSQQRGSSPVAMAIRTDFIIPTTSGFGSLYSDQVQSGAFNFGVSLIVSRKWSNLMETTLNLPVVITKNPRSNNADLLNQADQFRPGFGFTVFPDKRFQIISEYTAVIFFGSSTQNTTFGPRDPVEGVYGIRWYPWKFLALDLGYRSAFNLNQVTDRNGFAIRVSTTFEPRKPVPIPEALDCSAVVADPTTIDATTGAPVTISVQASATPAGAMTYSYESSGGRIDGSGSKVRWDYSGLGEGTYTISPTVTKGNLKAACGPVSVKLISPPPVPRLACSANPAAPVYSGEYVEVTATATDPKGNPLPYPVTYEWRASGGAVEGSGATVRLNTTGLAPGDYSVTARAEGKGGAADCSAPVNVKSIEPAREIARCQFKKFSASVTNACKNPPLDGVPPRFRQFPNSTLVIEATADPSETHEAASKAMKTKGKAKLTAEQLAKDRAENVKRDLVQRLGLPDSAIETHTSVGKKGGGEANQTMKITLVPQGAKYEPEKQ